MAHNYAFKSILGAPYQGGQLTFSSDGDALLCPIGNRIVLHDLKRNQATTLAFEARQNIQHVVFSPKDPLLFVIDETGRCLIINFVRSIVLNRIYFRGAVTAVAISPCGAYLAVATGAAWRIWETPSAKGSWQLQLRHRVRQHQFSITSLSWSSDSKYLVTSSDDLTVRLFSRDAPDEDFVPLTFVGHRYPVRAAFLASSEHGNGRIISVAEDGLVIIWEQRFGACSGDRSANRAYDLSKLGKIRRKRRYESIKNEVKSETSDKVSLVKKEPDSDDDIGNRRDCKSLSEGTWEVVLRELCNAQHKGKVTCARFNIDLSFLVVGFNNGTVGLFDLTAVHKLGEGSLTNVYTLSFESDSLETVTLNSSGEWIALASRDGGHIIVWEWRSETYILKQQAHRCGIRCVAAAPIVDSATAARSGNLSGRSGRRNVLATGGEDGKLKLWDSENGFNFVTLSEHRAVINDVCFTPNANAVLTASSDGTVRAFDMVRYRNFRTLTCEGDELVQYDAVATDGDIVVSGGRSSDYVAYIWSLQTGKLLERLSGHSAAISSVRFSPDPQHAGTVASGSWDGTIRVWDVFARANKGGSSEPLVCSSAVLALAFDPRGNQRLAASTLAGNIWVWDLRDEMVIGTIDGLRDIRSGRILGQAYSANNQRAVSKKEKRLKGSVGAGVLTNQHFSSLIYAPHGRWILAAAKTSSRICIYDSDKFLLLNVVTLTRNLSLEGLLMELSSEYVTETGKAINELDISDDDDDEIPGGTYRKRRRAGPGVAVGEHRAREGVFQCWGLCFSQDGALYGAATSHGVFVYQVDSLQGGGTTNSYVANANLERFAPNLMTRSVNPENIRLAVQDQSWSKALVLALALNDRRYLDVVYHLIPYSAAPVVVQSIPPFLLPGFLNFMRHLKALQQSSGSDDSGISGLEITVAGGLGMSDIRNLCFLLLRSVQEVNSSVTKLFDANLRSLDFVLAQRKLI